MRPAAGIIAEYNPFHHGHARQIAALRERLGPDCPVAVVMSGSFVQRGEPAIFRKHVRAEAALRCGVNLVLELPGVYAAAGAETFARGGTALLAATGVVTHLCFGSECGTLEPLLAAAEALDSPAYRQTLHRLLEQGMSFAAARQQAVRELAGEAADCLGRPNDNLAVEYLRALRALGGGMEPIAVQRLGPGHDSPLMGAYPSASLIRGRILGGETWRELVPEPSADLLEREIAAGRGPASLAQGERAILSVLRGMEETDFRPYDGGGEGLYRRFYQAVRQGRDLTEVLTLAKTKRYPMARLRRMALSAYLRLPPPPEHPPYLRLLAADRQGCALLREMKQRARLPVVTKPADIRKLDDAAAALFAAEARCTGLYTLCCPRLWEGTEESEYTTGPVILTEWKEGDRI